MTRRVPQGYERFEVARAQVVAHHRLAGAIREAMAVGSLYEWARSHPEVHTMRGRVPAYAAPLPGDGVRIVVRRSHHGGLLAPFTRDLFLPPTRAPRELATALHLAASGVPTPPVAAYAIYPAAIFRRADVATIELPGRDLGAALIASADDDARRALVHPVAALLSALAAAGAWHPDLNVKNILLVDDEHAVTAEPNSNSAQPVVLDVDRVTFVPPGDHNLREANLGRLLRSMEKWRSLHGVGFTPPELDELRTLLTHHEEADAARRALALEEFMP